MASYQYRVRFTHAQRKVVADLLPNLADRLKLDQNNSRTISWTAEELETIREQVEVASSRARNGMVRNSLWHVVDAINKALGESAGFHVISAAEPIYQFKITLHGVKPPIWRRIQIKNCTLDKLHESIQTAMGWTNSHLHRFEIGGVEFGDPELLDDGFEDFDCVDSTKIKIGQILSKEGPGFRFRYDYDFGDGWQHRVIFEGCLEAEQGVRYPICLAGKRACPPEDVGGVWGYAGFLEAIHNPDHEEHEAFMAWIGEFDPEAFEAGEATKAMRRGLPGWRQGAE